MASIGRLMTPVNGKCIGLNWYKGFTSCPSNLMITYPGYDVTTGFAGMAVVFNGGAKVGDPSLTDCGTDAYVDAAVTIGSLIQVDVWAAYRAGAWTSSVTILVYHGQSAPACTLEAGPDYATPVTKAITPQAGTTCAAVTTLKATVTVNDDGTFSIA